MELPMVIEEEWPFLLTLLPPGWETAARELHAFERRSYRDIATALAIPQNTVGTRLLRARKKLRVLLLGGREVET